MSKLLITNCKSKIKSLLDRVRGKEVTHIIVTTTGDKIKCIESTDLYDGDIKIVVAKCIIGSSEKILTINYDNIEYILENYNDNVWNVIINLPVNNSVDNENDNLYS